MSTPKVFISYSHDSPDHADRVLALADRLREDGIDCILDQYEESPPEGWTMWMDRHITNDDFVLMICTGKYYCRVMGEEEPGEGLGVKWEGKLIYQHIYGADSTNTRFIPVLLAADQVSYIPTPLQDATHYRMDTEYETLYRRLTHQPVTIKPDLGKLRTLPTRERKQDFFSDMVVIDMKRNNDGIQKEPVSDQADFVIITALDKEAKAVVNRLDNCIVRHFEDQDIRTYRCGTVPIRGTSNSYSIVVVLLPSMGELSAANAVTDAITCWNPRFVLMIGIAGGFPQDDLDLGDVVVADQVVGYEYGKVTDHGLKPRDRVYPVSSLLLERIRNFWGDSWVQQVNVPRPGNSVRAISKVFVGPIASGNKVVASTKFRQELTTRWPKLIAVEMEAEGVFSAVFDRPQIRGTLVIRGICDMADERKADERKGDEWQEYAANAAAAFAIDFLKSGPVERHEITPVSPAPEPRVGIASGKFEEESFNKDLVNDYVELLKNQNFKSETVDEVLAAIRREAKKVYDKEAVNEESLPAIEDLIQFACASIKEKKLVNEFLDILYLLIRDNNALQLVKENCLNILTMLFDGGERDRDLLGILYNYEHFGNITDKIIEAIDKRDKELLNFLIDKLDESRIEERGEFRVILLLKLDKLGSSDNEKAMRSKIRDLIRRLEIPPRRSR